MWTSIANPALALLAVASTCAAQFPAEPEGITVLRSRFNDGVTISFKEASA